MSTTDGTWTTPLKDHTLTSNASTGKMRFVMGLDKILRAIDDAGNVTTYPTSGAFFLKTGDTATGQMNFAADLFKIGTNQLVAANGNIGVNCTPAANHQFQVVLPANKNFFIDAETNLRTSSEGIFRIHQKPAIPGTRAVHIQTDANGQPDTRDMLFQYKATGIANGMEAHSLEINVDTDASTGGEFAAVSVVKVNSGAMIVAGLECYGGVEPVIQHAGNEVVADQNFKYDGSYIDVNTAFGGSGANVEIFSGNNDYVYFGHSTIFNQINFIFSILASTGGILPTFEYSKGSAVWQSFAPVDGTNGMRENGAVLFETAAYPLWATDTVNAVSGKYWIRIRRTNAALATPPTESFIKIIASTEYGWYNDGSLVVGPITTPSITGNAGTATTLQTARNINRVSFNGSADIEVQAPPQYVNAGGTAEVITATLSPAIPALTNGLLIIVGAASANTTTTPTLNVNGLGAKVITKGENVALVAGDISGSNHKMLLCYNSVTTSWCLQNPALSSVSLVFTPVGGTADAITLTPVPPLPSYALAVGQRFMFIASGTNTVSPPTVNFNGLGAINTTMGSVAVPVGGLISGNIYWILIETATSARISPYDAVSSNGDTVNGTMSILSGVLGVGYLGASSNTGLYITSNALTTTGQYGVIISPTATSAATSSGTGIYTSIASAAAAYTMTNAYGIQVGAPIKGSGSTITNTQGIRIEDTSAGANNYGLVVVTAAGANKWGYYGSGTAQNAFAGLTRFGGVTAPVATVDITGTLRTTGVIGIGGATSTQSAISANAGLITTGSTVHTVFNASSIYDSTATVYGISFYSAPQTANSAFTLADGISFLAGDFTKGASNTITRQTGLLVSDQTKGTSNYGIQNQVTSGANKWGYYGSGTAQNYMAGKLGLGAITTPASSISIGNNTAGEYIAEMFTHTATVDGAGLKLVKGRGTYASPTAALSGDNIAAVDFWTRGATTYAESAAIDVDCTENHSEANRGSKMMFLTTTNATTTPVVRLEIAHNGKIAIGGATTANLLEVYGTIKSNTGGFVFPDGTTMTTAAATSAGVSSITDVNIAADTDANGSGAIIFATNGTTRLTIANNGTMTLGSGDSIGFLEIPQVSQSANYTTVLTDSGKHILHPSADTTARTFTIDSNANVAYPLGTAIMFINQNGGGVITIAITADTMRLAGTGTTGSRTLAANGVCTAVKVATTEWIISGIGLS